MVEAGADLTGQVALVTGCGRAKGIGRSIALSLASAGADVAIADLVATGVRNEGEPTTGTSGDGLDRVVAEITELGRRAFPVTGDIAEASHAQAMVDAVVAEFGHVDILVNNAGAPHGADRAMTWEVPPEAFDAVMRTNARGTFLMSAAVVRHLLGRSAPGRIVNIASVAGKVGYPQRAAYCASKFAVIGLTQSLALELASYGITVNAVCPGAIGTDRNAATRHRGDTAADTGARMAGTAPVGRIGEPGDIARTVTHLVDPRAGYVTGQSLVVAGGIYLT
jgi:NAD(P)-dependent dehydrogenase (short-subunit alcohol dehydrogenase family)